MGQAAPHSGEPAAAKADDARAPTAAQMLGARAEQVRQGWPSLSTVVVVPDEASFVEAVARWRLPTKALPEGSRYPVLIDDGTALAREDIARFVRGFTRTVGEVSVVRWSAGTDAKWPADRAGREAALTAAMARFWTQTQDGELEPAKVGTQTELVSRWSRFGVRPAGVVVADAMDRAWPAALALGAGRLQPIVFIDGALAGAAGVNGSMTPSQFAALHDAVRRGLEGLAVPYARLGDEIEAVTLCLHAPVKVQVTPEAIYATTDLLGRTWDPAAPDKGTRWAWSGQIIGTEAQSAYRAMCGLFLGTKSAWLFDGYGEGDPWRAYDATAAGRVAKDAGVETVKVEDAPKQSERQWRLATAFGVDAAILAVNTHGMADEFNLSPGRCRPGDVPGLLVPGIVYVVHSFSAQAPENRSTVAGRFLERGAYAYFGSVHEPFLQAFVPTPVAMGRMLSGLPLGAALRFDGGPVGAAPAWRLTLLGDPLIVLNTRIAVAEEAVRKKGPPLQGTKDVAQEVAEAAKAGEFERTIVSLVLLGRDEDAAKLAAGLLRDRPGEVTAGVAAAAIPSLQRTRRAAELAAAFALLPADRAKEPPLRDALWQSQYPGLGSLDAKTVSTLRANVRPDQPGRDAADLASAVERTFNRESATTMLREAQAASKTEWDRQEVETAMKRLGGRR